MIKEGSKPADSCSTVRISLRRARQPAGLPGTFGCPQIMMVLMIMIRSDHDDYNDDQIKSDDDDDKDNILTRLVCPVPLIVISLILTRS